MAGSRGVFLAFGVFLVADHSTAAEVNLWIRCIIVPVYGYMA